MHEITETERGVERAAYDDDTRAVAGVEHLRFFPLAVQRGSGRHLHTPSGRVLLDLSASWGAASFGHAEPRIVEAITHAAQQGAGASVLSSAVGATTHLAQRLLATVPTKASERVYLGLGGTDANSVAISAARHATGRDGVVSFVGSYHGGHGLGQQAQGMGVQAGNTTGVSTVFDLPVDAEALERVENELREHLTGETTACVIVEAVQCDGGVRVPAAGFLRALRQVCDRTGTLLICDEVKTGMGRTGQRFAYQHEEIAPDLVTLGKALGAGLPVGAVVGPATALDGPTASALLTLAGSPIGAATATAVVEQLDEDLLEHVRQRGDQAAQLLARYRRSRRPGAAAVTDVRGRGLLLGVELADEQLAALTCYRAWELGCVFYVVRDDVLELTPPLSITAEEVEEGISILTRAVDDVAQGRVDPAVLEEFSGW